MQMDCDVLVAGGGSGGFGAALAAARHGCRVVLAERETWLGGSSTHSGVNGWESGCGGTGFPFELYRHLKQLPDAVGIYRVGRHCCWPDAGDYPGGEGVLDPSLRYVDTLVRYALGPLSYGRQDDRPLIRKRWNGVVFEPKAMSDLMREMLHETGNVDIRTGTCVTGVESRHGRITEVHLSTGRSLKPRYVVDSTGDGNVCAACAVPQWFGQDPRARFGEPGAAEEPDEFINGVTLVFRVTPKSPPGVDPLDDDLPDACWWRARYPAAHVVHYPNGDMSVNMLPTMEGQEFRELGEGLAYHECQRRVRAFWRAKQKDFPEWQHYRINWVAPTLGVRESQRTLCEAMLTQHDITAGLSRQTHRDIVAIADHSMDVHGAHAKGCRETSEAYGIPFGCLIPKGRRNLLVASRAAGFSAIAASSCRLSRTMMQLGQAAGSACGLAMAETLDLPDIAADRLRSDLLSQHVCLQFPPSPSLMEYLRQE